MAPLQGLNPLVLDTATESNRADIRQYVRHELAAQLENRPDAERFVEQILEKSEGVFLYVEHVCAECQCGNLSLDRLDEFPQGLGGVFFLYFQRQFPDLEKFRKDVRPALRAILAAREPLPVEVLQRLFNWQEEELRDFIRPLGSLFPVTTESGCETIKPYHKSLADWLADERKAEAYYASVHEGHKMLADNLRKFVDLPGREGKFVRTSLPLHLALREDWPRFFQAMSDETFLKSLRWNLPDSLLSTALSICPGSMQPSLVAIPMAFATCARSVSLRAAGFPYIHEDTIESVRRAGPNAGFSVQRKDGTRMPLAEMEPNNNRMYEFIGACRRLLRCAFDFSTHVEDTAGSRTWLIRFLKEHVEFKEELEAIDSHYERTHFGPSLRASETVFMWESILSGDADKESHARSSY